jgi:hypothetical protein
MRTVILTAGLIAVSLIVTPARASSPDDKILDQQGIEAQPREQCFLYAEVVHQMTEMSLRQYAAGNVDAASGLLKKIQALSQKIHLSLANDDKRLKNTELLLNHTAFRLNELLHASSFEDRPLVQATLTQVDHAQNEAMMQVFQK